MSMPVEKNRLNIYLTMSNQFTYILNKITDLERRLGSLEKYNQVTTLEVGDFFVLDSTGMEMTMTGTLASYIRFYKSTVKIADITQTASGTTSSDMIFRSFMNNVVNSIAYTTMAIYNQSGGREAFLQINKQYVSSVFTVAGLDFSLDGVNSTFGIRIIDTVGSGYLMVPHSSSDPTGTSGTPIYFNTTTNKLKVLEGGAGWKTITTT